MEILRLVRRFLCFGGVKPLYAVAVFFFERFHGRFFPKLGVDSQKSVQRLCIHQSTYIETHGCRKKANAKQCSTGLSRSKVGFSTRANRLPNAPLPANEIRFPPLLCIFRRPHAIAAGRFPFLFVEIIGNLTAVQFSKITIHASYH